MTIPAENAKPVRMAARYESLMTICRQAFADAQYDASYHALAASMHCAIELDDIGRLAAVEALATEQIEQIDTDAPGYHHSTSSAVKRGHPSLLATLAQQSHSRALIATRAAKKEASA